MIGPEKRGHWSGIESHNGGRIPHGHLLPDVAYTIVQPFTDYDGDVHPAGETWVYRGCSFYPYEDGLSLFVSLNDEDEWHIRMQWRPEEQGDILDDLKTYIRPAFGENLCSKTEEANR